MNWQDELKAYMEKNFQPHPDMGSDLDGFHNLMKEAHPDQVETSTGTPEGYCNGGMVKGYAEGGIVEPSDPGVYDVTDPVAPVSLIPKFNPHSGLPPAPVAPVMPISAPQTPASYLGAQKANLSKYGPEQQLALEQSLLKQRNSLGSKAPVALGGLADSIMQGVARAGSGGFADRIEGRQNAQAKEQMDALKSAGEGNLSRQSAGMKLDEMDPQSPLSKTAQQTWGALLSRNGFKPAQIANMPASSIAALTGQTVEALKAESEAKMAAATLGLKTQEAAQTAKHQTAEENTAAEREKLDAAGKLSGRGMFKKATDAIFGDPGTEALENKLNSSESGVTPEVTDQMSYDSLPSGSLYTHNGIQHRKK